MNTVDFLTREMVNVEYGNTDIPFTIEETFLGDVILVINSMYDGHTGDCQVVISPTLDNCVATRWQESQGFATFDESMRFAKHIQLAASIALKWQAHVAQEKLLDTQPVSPPFIDDSEFWAWEDESVPDDYYERQHSND